MRRTVNEARAPSPRLRMTVPSKIYVRSFSPSMTFTCTRTWSPGSKPWRSFLSCDASTIRLASIPFAPLCPRGPRRRLSALNLLDHPPILVRQARLREELGAPPPRQPQGLLPPPARHARVVAGQQHLRHPRAAKLLGARVLRRLQHARRERLPLGGALAAQHARQQARHRVGHHHGRQLAPRQHVVADREPLVGEPLPHPPVHAPVASR